RDYAAVKVLSSVLGGGMAGRLFVELRDKRALAYTATAFYEPMKEPGVIVLYLGTTPQTATQAEQALLAEVERIKREPVPDAELARARRYLVGRYAMTRRRSRRRSASCTRTPISSSSTSRRDCSPWPPSGSVGAPRIVCCPTTSPRRDAPRGSSSFTGSIARRRASSCSRSPRWS